MAHATSRRQPPRRTARAAPPAARTGQRRLLVAVVIGAVLIAAGLIALNRPPDAGAGVALAAASLPAGVPVSGRVIGDPAAPVHVVEYGDYQCRHCGDFAREVEPALIADLVASGQISFEYRDLAFLGRESTTAAVAAAAAADQDRFWDFHATLFANQQGVDRGAFTADRLRAMAQGLGLDLNAYDAAIADPAVAQQVADMSAEAGALGITGTPTFVINGEVVPWAGYDALKAAIAAAAR